MSASQPFVVTAQELEYLLFIQEFSEWLSGLSAPARRQIKALPTEARMSLARQIVDKRVNGLDECPVGIGSSTHAGDIFAFQAA